MPLVVWPGKPYPLGATWDGEGVNFALFSEHAEKVELCLFDEAGRREIDRIPLTEHTDQVWHCYLPEARPGLLYGYRVTGLMTLTAGHRFNRNKLLLDPYAKQFKTALSGTMRISDTASAHRNADLSFDRRDSAPGMLKGVVVDPAFTWGSDRPPRTPWHRTIIYETHVKGFTIQHPDVPAGVARHLRWLWPLPPSSISEASRRDRSRAYCPCTPSSTTGILIERGLRNYWGYNSIGFFAPEPRYLARSAVDQ